VRRSPIEYVIVINLNISKKYYNSYILSNAKKIGSIVDLSALAIYKSVFFWPPRDSPALVI
jgi:hypothetical protein